MISEEKILNAKILIVDDNILNIQVLKKILNNAGFFNIVFTTEASQTVQLYQENHPDLLLLDYNMPNKNGLEIIEELCTLYPKGYLPLLMLTAENDPQLKLKALQWGAKDFLTKPYDRIEVVLRSRNIIEVRILYLQTMLQNSSLEDQIFERTKELQDTRLDVVQRLARMAEYRDKDTGLHIIRMSQYCYALAKSLGLTQIHCDLILATAPLHDIGKIAIPDSILLKPGKLEQHEIEVMHSHTTIGSKILAGSSSTFLMTAAIIAQTHHERWDGTGYPHQLKGEDIPLVGRISAICDVFDALTSQRPYKDAWTYQHAIDEIFKQKGKHFDPALIDIFSSIQKEICHIYDTYQ